MTREAETDEPGGEAAKGAQRLDKWLWFARVTKSRSLAAACIEAGEVKLNRIRVDKPSQTVKVGDVITSRVHKHVRVLRVLKLGTRRGPASEAQGLYEDLTPKPEPVSASDPAQPMPQAFRDAGSGRPTKRDRRLLDKFIGRAR